MRGIVPRPPPATIRLRQDYGGQAGGSSDPPAVRRARPDTNGRDWLRVASAVSAALVLGTLVIERWPAERTWPTALLAYSPHLQWLALPTLIVAWSACARRPRAALFNGAIWLIALFGLAGFQVPLRVPARGAPDTVRIATWNVHKRRASMAELTRQIVTWDCDVVCVQEVEKAGFRGLLPDYAHAHVRDLRTFVRGEILDSKVFEHANRKLRPTLACDVRVAGKRFTVVNAHFSTSDRWESLAKRHRPVADYLHNTVRVRAIQYDRVLAWVPEGTPLVIAGDFNTPPNSMFHRRMRRRLTDSFAAAGLGFGYTFLARGMPILRIDYIWTANGVEPAACWTAGAAPSDHRPVIAEVRLPQAAKRQLQQRRQQQQQGQ